METKRRKLGAETVRLPRVSMFRGTVLDRSTSDGLDLNSTGGQTRRGSSAKNQDFLKVVKAKSLSTIEGKRVNDEKTAENPGCGRRDHCRPPRMEQFANGQGWYWGAKWPSPFSMMMKNIQANLIRVYVYMVNSCWMDVGKCQCEWVRSSG